MADNNVPGGAPHPGSHSSPDPESGSALDRVYDTLRRSPVRRLREGRVIGGVASGLARHFGFDPVLVRVAFVVLGMLLGIGLSLYLLAWFLLPDENDALALERAVRDHDPGSIVLGAFAALSLLNAPRGDDGGWWTVLSVLVVAGFVFFFVRRHRGGSGRCGAGGSSGSHGSSGTADGPDAQASSESGQGGPAHPGIARSHGSPSRGGDTSVFDPVTGRWVPAVHSERAPAREVQPPARSPGNDVGRHAEPSTPSAFPAGYAEHDWSPPATASPVAASSVAPPALRGGLGVFPTILVLLGAAILAVGAAWIVQSAAIAANVFVVGAAVALTFLSAVVVALSLRGRRARALALGVLLLLPFAAGVASVERTSPGGAGFSIQVGPR